MAGAGKGREQKLLTIPDFAYLCDKGSLSPGTLVCISLATLRYKKFCERNFYSSFSSRRRQEGRVLECTLSDPTHSFPTGQNRGPCHKNSKL